MPAEVLNTVRQFFITHKVNIPGVDVDDFYHALYLAIDKGW
jgi:hypothetical protein